MATASCVINNDDISKERVLGSKFDKEIATGRKLFGNADNSNDPRMRDMDELIADMDLDQHN